MSDVEDGNLCGTNFTDRSQKIGCNSASGIYSNIYRENSSKWNGISHILFRWRGSVYKEVWNLLLGYCVAYFILSVLYRTVFVHNPVQKQAFEIICVYAQQFSNGIPLTFLIGFYVAQVVNRWWAQFMALPYPDFLALKLVAYVPGHVS